MSTAELPKNYEPSSIEAEAYRVWLEEKCFHADPAKSGEPYSIVIPPPNVTGALHLGHAINGTLQDILVRSHRMRGFNTLWVPGIDHAGIATQAVVEKQLKEKENKTRHDVGREALVERIWAWKEQYGNRIIEQLKRVGCSCDWDRTRFTLDEMCAKAVRETFFKLFKDGLIYRGKRLVNWDVFLQTSVSDDEIYHETVKTSLWHIKYPIEGTGEYMVVATTRPETMLGDTAVAVHSEDGRWNKFIGENVRLPLTNRLIPIIADDILVDPKFGSGVVKVTPAHDPNDYAVWQRHLGKLDAINKINIMTPEGFINENGGPYASLRRDVARKKVVEDLTAQGLLVKEEPYETQIGHSDRSKTPIEPYESDQWFIRMLSLAEPALEVVRNGKVKFTPERYAQGYLSWLGEKRDWPISRQLWWGHRIPVWTFKWGMESSNTWNEKSLDERESYRHEKLANLLIFFRLAGLEDDVCVIRQPDSAAFHICVRSEPAEQLIHAIEEMIRIRHRVPRDRSDQSGPPDQGVQPKQIETFSRTIRDAAYDLLQDTHLSFFRVTPGEKLDAQDPDVLDTWFSSALWPHSTLGWPEQTPELKRYYPTSVLVTSRDIITLWVARMVMTGLYNMGEIPFHDVYIHATILDGKGERMSKSKGNGVDPVDIIDTHGADALRFTLTQMATETQDVRLPVKKDAQGRNTSDKFDVGRNFCNKLWNAARFVLSNFEQACGPAALDNAGSAAAPLIDRWILSRFNRTVAEADQALAAYRFDQYAKVCYDFFWRDFCDWYVEASKPAMKDPATRAQTANVLAATLDGILRLMHPMIPFITEIIWWRLNAVRPERSLSGWIECSKSQRLVLASWPKVGGLDESAEEIFPRLQEIVGAIRTIRNDYKVEPKKPVTVSISAPEDTARQIESNRGVIELLASCSLKAVGSNLAAVLNAAHTSAVGCDIFVEGLVDQNAEKDRMNKRCEELKKQVAALNGRLNNAGYIAKAPPHLVEQTKAQLAEAEAEMAKLGC